MTVHVHWSCMCQYAQGADFLLCSWLLTYRKYKQKRTVVKSRDFFSWTNDKVELLLTVYCCVHTKQEANFHVALLLRVWSPVHSYLLAQVMRVNTTRRISVLCWMLMSGGYRHIVVWRHHKDTNQNQSGSEFEIARPYDNTTMEFSN